jgi:hypothetical protein
VTKQKGGEEASQLYLTGKDRTRRGGTGEKGWSEDKNVRDKDGPSILLLVVLVV